MSYYHQHNHTNSQNYNFRSAQSPESFASVVGSIDQNTEHNIQGRSGDHLQFYVEIGNDIRYQVDVNTQSSDGSDVEVYIAAEDLSAVGNNSSQPFGAEAYGVFPDAQLSYQGLGLNDAEFTSIGIDRIESQLEAALSQAEFVAIYGQVFDDGGANGQGIHETHYIGKANQDGGIAIYSKDPSSGAPKRTWFFFKFQGDHI